MRDLALLVPYARRHRRGVAAALAICVALAIADVPLPFVLKHVLDGALHGPDTTGAGRLLGEVFVALCVLALAKAALLYGQRAVTETVGQKIVHALRLDLYRHLQSLSLGYFRGARTGKLMLRLVGDVKAVLDMVTTGMLRAFADGVTVLAVVVAVFSLHPRLALILLAGMPLYIGTFIRLSPRLRESGRRARRERSQLSGHLQERIAGAAVVKAFRREEDEARALSAQTARLRDRQIETARLGGRLAAFAHVAIALGGALVLFAGGHAVLRGELTRGGLMAFYALAGLLFPPLRRLARTNETFQSARVSIERIASFLADTAPHRERDGARDLRVTAGAIRFENVAFGYDGGRVVLDGVDVAIEAGTVVALVGANGAGKSTLVSLLTRFAAPSSGRIVIDGQDVAEVTLASLRRQVGIVTQDCPLFSGTIEDNIRYGRPDASADEIVAAAAAAGVVEFAASLPGGLATEVGERGQRLSAGQAQRVAIARALLTDPPVLVLDEATSAVDAASEGAIQAALGRLMHGRTVIVIAHRISTVRRADRVLVLEGGRIVEDGVHDGLLRARGTYARLFDEQLIAPAV